MKVGVPKEVVPNERRVALTPDAAAKLGLEVTIPGEGNPTGQLFNSTTNFHGDAFIFVSEDGTINLSQHPDHNSRPEAVGQAMRKMATKP